MQTHHILRTPVSVTFAAAPALIVSFAIAPTPVTRLDEFAQREEHKPRLDRQGRGVSGFVQRQAALLDGQTEPLITISAVGSAPFGSM
jgi:hypothetical protein